MFQIPDLSIREIILAVEGDTTIFPAGTVVRLYSNDYTPTKADSVSSYTEVTNVEVPGYAPLALAFNGTPVRQPTGTWEDLGSAPLTFQATGTPPAPQIAYGWFATNAGKTIWVGAGRFAAPFTFEATGDGFSLLPQIQASQLDGNNYNLFLEMEPQ
jgi:hypothetical protein